MRLASAIAKSCPSPCTSRQRRQSWIDECSLLSDGNGAGLLVPRLLATEDDRSVMKDGFNQIILDGLNRHAAGDIRGKPIEHLWTAGYLSCLPSIMLSVWAGVKKHEAIKLCKTKKRPLLLCLATQRSMISWSAGQLCWGVRARVRCQNYWPVRKNIIDDTLSYENLPYRMRAIHVREIAFP